MTAPREALRRAAGRALGQPGAKWTPATGWTDEPVPERSLTMAKTKPTGVALAAARRLSKAVDEVLFAWQEAFAALPEQDKAYYDGYVTGWLRDDFVLPNTRLDNVPKTVLGYMADAVSTLRGEDEV